MKKFSILLIVAIITFIAMYFIFKPAQKAEKNNFSKVKKVELSLIVPDSLNADVVEYKYFADFVAQTIDTKEIYTNKRLVTNSYPFSYDEFREMLKPLLEAKPTADTTIANVKMYEPDTVKYYITDKNMELINLINAQ